MILDHPPYSPSQHKQPPKYQVTIANGETVEIIGSKLATEGGALVIYDLKGGLEVAFGPGAWLEVQRA